MVSVSAPSFAVIRVREPLGSGEQIIKTGKEGNTDMLFGKELSSNAWVQCFCGVVCNDHPTCRNDKLANLKFGVGNRVARNSDIGGSVQTTEEDVFTPVGSSDHHNLRPEQHACSPSLHVVFVDI